MPYTVLLLGIILLASCSDVKESMHGTKQFFSDNISTRKPVNDYLRGKRLPAENDYYIKMGEQQRQQEQQRQLRQQQIKQQAEQIRMRNQQTGY